MLLSNSYSSLLGIYLNYFIVPFLLWFIALIVEAMSLNIISIISDNWLQIHQSIVIVVRFPIWLAMGWLWNGILQFTTVHYLFHKGFSWFKARFLHSKLHQRERNNVIQIRRRNFLITAKWYLDLYFPMNNLKKLSLIYFRTTDQ